MKKHKIQELGSKLAVHKNLTKPLKKIHMDAWYPANEMEYRIQDTLYELRILMYSKELIIEKT